MSSDNPLSTATGLKLIVQHTPKCAGTSLVNALRAAFGQHEVFRDYDGKLTDPTSLFQSDREAYWADARRITPNQPVIIGHFPLRKYEHLGRALRVGTIRHPVPRLISHYCYWKRSPNGNGHLLHKQVLAGTLGILDLARVPTIRHFFRDIYFNGVASGHYDLLIRQEDFAAGVSRLSALIGRPLEVLHSRVTNLEEEASLRGDAALLRRLHDELADDIAVHDALIGTA